MTTRGAWRWLQGRGGGPRADAARFALYFTLVYALPLAAAIIYAQTR